MRHSGEGRCRTALRDDCDDELFLVDIRRALAPIRFDIAADLLCKFQNGTDEHWKDALTMKHVCDIKKELARMSRLSQPNCRSQKDRLRWIGRSRALDCGARVPDSILQEVGKMAYDFQQVNRAGVFAPCAAMPI